MDVAAAKAFLQKKEGSASVYDHLTEVLLKILTDRPENAVAVFEQISSNVKAATYPDFAVGGKSTVGTAEHEEAKSKLLTTLASHFKAPAADEEGNGGPGEPVQDLTEESNYLEWAGVSLGRTETFRLHLALKYLAAKEAAGTKNLRFFGRIFGRTNDYYIAEGVMDAPEDEPEEEKDALGNLVQRTGEGPNKFTYYVCHGIGQPWVRLPRVTPHQIVVARQIRRYLTGNLDAPVLGHPPFPGTERNYLRALIAIISSATAIAPSGVFTAVDGDENGAIEPNAEEFEAPDLTSADSWQHITLELNKLGRTKPNPPKTDENGEEVADPDAPEPSAPLKGISEDAPVVDDGAEGNGAWDIRVLPVSGIPEGETPAAPIVAVKSLRFPGAVTVGLGKKYTSIYIGYGHEVTLAAYQPVLPSNVPAAEYDMNGESTQVKEKVDVTVAPPEPTEEEQAEE